MVAKSENPSAVRLNRSVQRAAQLLKALVESPNGTGLAAISDAVDLHDRTASRFTVVSGGARGTDSLAHEEAVNAGGNTIVVLAEGILTSSSRRLVRAVDHGAVAVVSTFLPQGSWQKWRAMGRNNYILGLSDRLAVIEARESGGTLAVGKSALKLDINTWVLDYEIPPLTATGNRLLLDLGAHPLRVTANLEVAIPDDLFALHNWKVQSLPPT